MQEAGLLVAPSWAHPSPGWSSPALIDAWTDDVIKTSEDVHNVRHIYHNERMKRLPSENAIKRAVEAFRRAGGTLRTREAADRGVHY